MPRSNPASERFTVLGPQSFEAGEVASRQFSLDVLLGLSEVHKRLSSKYFYDDDGSRIFQRICELDEYYLTRCETEILERSRGQIATLVGREPFNLVELGAGDGRKTKILLSHFLDHGLSFRYVPIDISESAMDELTRDLAEQMPELELQGLVSDYVDGLRWIARDAGRRTVVLFLGSNIGNFQRSEARAFLRSLWSALSHDDLVLIGFDLKKDIDVMLRAYNDSAGVTAEFNLNLLRRINAELGGHFDTNAFRFYATYDVFSGAMESYLVSLREQTVSVDRLGGSFSFRAFEPIHTEYSYKYLESDIEALAADTGYSIALRLYDQRLWFTDSVWQVRKDG